MKFRWKELIVSLAISLGTGALSSILTPNIGEKYELLYQPPFSPPGWVFPVAWTVLYVLMGLGAFLIYVSEVPCKEKEFKEQTLKLYAVQLILNLLWPLIFFRLGAYLPAFIWLIALWFVVFLLVKRFGEIDELAGKLMMPYLLWLTYAAYLNLAVALESL